MSGWRKVPFTKNRFAIYDMLNRARRFHAPVTGSVELDVTDTRARIRADRAKGRRVGLLSFLVRATALVVRAHPKLQRHLFTTWYGRPREIAFDRISCTLIVARKKEDGEEILLPLKLDDPDQLSVEEIQEILTEVRTKPLEALEEVQAMERIKKAPRFVLTWFSYKARSDPTFYAKYFGTYGLSSMMDPGGPVLALATVANTASAFLPSTLKERPWIVKGEIVPRSILNMSVVLDHHLVDGGESLRVGRTLRNLVEKPERVLGPPPGVGEDAG